MAHSIMIIDDHPIVREGLKMVIETENDLKVVATAANGKDALAQLGKMDSMPDLVVIDLLMPMMDGQSLINHLLGKTMIFILSTEIDLQVATEVVNKGIRGYLLKDETPTKIVDSIKKVFDDPNYIAMSPEVLNTVMESKQKGQSFNLTPQQIQLLKYVADGETNEEIAKKMFVTSRTIKNYLSAIYKTLGVHNRAQAIAIAVKNGLI